MSSDKIRKQVEEGLKRTNIESVRDTFDFFKVNKVISASTLGPALRDLGVSVNATDIDEMLKSRDLNDDGSLDFEEFLSLVHTPSPIDEWVKELPLTEIVASAMPRVNCPIKDQLRHLSRATSKQLEESCEIIKEKLLEVLLNKQAVLCKSYEKLDCHPAANGNTKFQTFQMNAGTIDNFHEGLSSRVGKDPLALNLILQPLCLRQRI